MIDNIYIENFRRIRKAFIPIRDGITVLTGNNGTGKSTIIEALLFNQYGKPKAGTTKDSIPSVRRGGDDIAYTSVDFTHHGTHYRCRRFITKKMSTIATLYSYTEDEYAELMRQDDIRHLDNSLGTKIATTTTGVNAAISQIVGLDYDGYRASLVATQKELDSLSTLTKEKKKQFFLDLLGYSRLDKMKPIASQNLRDKTNMRDGIARQSLDPVSLRRELARTNATLDDVNARMEKGRGLLERLQSDSTRINAEYDRLKTAHDAYHRAVADNAKDSERVASLVQQQQAYKDVIAKNADLARDYDEKTTIVAKLATSRERLAKAQAYANTKSEYERILSTSEATGKRVTDIAKAISDMEGAHKDMPDLDKAQDKLVRLQQEKALDVQERKRLESEMRKLKRLMESVERGELTKCPTCGSQMDSEDGKAHLAKEMSKVQEAIGEIESVIAPIESDMETAKKDVDITKQALRTWHDEEKRIGRLQKEMSVLRKEQEDITVDIERKSQSLRQAATDAMDKKSMMALADDIATLERQALQEEGIRKAFEAMRDAKHKLEVIDASVAELSARIKANEKTIKAGDKTERAFERATSDRDACTKKLEAFRNRVTQLAEQRGTLTSSAKTLTEQIRTAETQQKDLSRLSTEIETWTGVRTVIDDLRESLPSRITPSLSVEASRLLEIATGGTYSMLEIDDEYEVSVFTDTDKRPIGQMSGGEQDIVSLCIRIAIAEMILESSGESAQTMVLDEIFGALDDIRKQEACDALRNLSSSLPRILCITHVDEIKDMADWMFVVEQDENGVSGVREVMGTSTMSQGKIENVA